MTLRNEIAYLISLRQEGGYWDFKKQWHDNKTSLLVVLNTFTQNNEPPYFGVALNYYGLGHKLRTVLVKTTT